MQKLRQIDWEMWELLGLTALMFVPYYAVYLGKRLVGINPDEN